jgi:hypothetical protein
MIDDVQGRTTGRTADNPLATPDDTDDGHAATLFDNSGLVAGREDFPNLSQRFPYADMRWAIRLGGNPVHSRDVHSGRKESGQKEANAIGRSRVELSC